MNTPEVKTIVGEIVTMKPTIYHPGQPDERLITILRVEGERTSVNLVLSDNASTAFLTGFAVGNIVDLEYEIRIKGVTQYVDAAGDTKEHNADGQAILSINRASLVKFGLKAIENASAGKEAAVAAFLAAMMKA